VFVANDLIDGALQVPNEVLGSIPMQLVVHVAESTQVGDGEGDVWLSSECDVQELANSRPVW
jgi:hypothetical protein